MVISAINNRVQASNYGCFLGRTNLKLKIQDIVAIVNNNASSKELKDIFGSSAKITVKNLVDIITRQSKHSKYGSRTLELIAAIINNGAGYKKKAMLGSNKINAETLVNIIKGSVIQARRSCSPASKHNASVKLPLLYNQTGQINKHNPNLNQSLGIIYDDVFEDANESFLSDDKVISKNNEIFYAAPEDLEDSENAMSHLPKILAQRQPSSMFGNLVARIKNFFGY
jgi:hypothetical protein